MPVSDVTATVINRGDVEVRWTPAVGAYSYVISRSFSGGPFGPWAGTTATSVIDAGVYPGQAVCYRVDAFDRSGQVSLPQTGPPGCVTVPPAAAAVASLIATALSRTSIRLDWPAAANAAEYVVLDWSVAGGRFVYVPATNNPSYTVNGLTPNRQYCFQVMAVNSLQAGAGLSPQACATTLA